MIDKPTHTKMFWQPLTYRSHIHTNCEYGKTKPFCMGYLVTGDPEFHSLHTESSDFFTSLWWGGGLSNITIAMYHVTINYYTETDCAGGFG